MKEGWLRLIVFVYLIAICFKAVVDDTPLIVAVFIVCLFVSGSICVTIAYYFLKATKSILQRILFWQYAVLGYSCISQSIQLYILRNEQLNIKAIVLRTINIIPLTAVFLVLAIYLFNKKNK